MVFGWILLFSGVLLRKYPITPIVAGESPFFVGTCRRIDNSAYIVLTEISGCTEFEAHVQLQ